MLFFLFRKIYIFWLILFSKKFIISNEKVEKQTTSILKTNCFQQKTKKTNTTLMDSKVKHFLKKIINVH